MDHLRGNQLDGLHFRRQQVTHGYIADFYCHSARLVVEVDGTIHDSQKEEDRKRDLALGDNGLKICCVKNEDVLDDLEGVLKRIREVCGVHST